MVTESPENKGREGGGITIISGKSPARRITLCPQTLFVTSRGSWATRG
ncbi:hypothetical protein AIOL_001820 [Candidatus Rhodobacter oscarellae]|uniref:Uncharacterized protein n=1 Tax=Candidatus Rhodobacter oscarellae TaxID=1675527 RepID=A0A0J9GTN0_9RHOB|nr:hypothetical protein AIOL_001820 [Candidatus Rhodobacter lobularis]